MRELRGPGLGAVEWRTCRARGRYHVDQVLHTLALESRDESVGPGAKVTMTEEDGDTAAKQARL